MHARSAPRARSSARDGCAACTPHACTRRREEQSHIAKACALPPRAEEARAREARSRACMRHAAGACDRRAPWPMEALARRRLHVHVVPYCAPPPPLPAAASVDRRQAAARPPRRDALQGHWRDTRPASWAARCRRVALPSGPPCRPLPAGGRGEGCYHGGRLPPRRPSLLHQTMLRRRGVRQDVRGLVCVSRRSPCRRRQQTRAPRARLPSKSTNCNTRTSGISATAATGR